MITTRLRQARRLFCNDLTPRSVQRHNMRAKAKRLRGEKYKTQMEELGRILKMTADRDGKPAIAIAADVCKKRGLIGMDLLLVMAAAVELTEPSNADATGLAPRKDDK